MSNKSITERETERLQHQRAAIISFFQKADTEGDRHIIEGVYEKLIESDIWALARARRHTETPAGLTDNETENLPE